MSKLTLYHNPRCSKSRKTLELIREGGVEPEIVEYLQEVPDAAQLKELAGLLERGLNPRSVARHLAACRSLFRFLRRSLSLAARWSLARLTFDFCSSMVFVSAAKMDLSVALSVSS